MATLHGYCTRHRIAYNRDLDPTCPQCTLAGIDVEQLDYLPRPPAPQPAAFTLIHPTTGETVDANTLKPVS